MWPLRAAGRRRGRGRACRRSREGAVAKIVIAAGGTAGHVVPALAVADALRERGADVEFIGGERAEAELVGLAARSLRLPLALSEADSHLGFANRLLAPLARRVFLAFPLEGRRGAKYLVTGRPVPADTGKVDRAAARERFGIPPNEPCVLIFGGSLGARRLNEAAVEAFGRASPCSVLHAAGRRDHDDLRRRLDELGSPAHYHLYPYIQPFADALAAADLVVARAGGSVLELAAAGLPAVLVPYPYATADHQTANARFMERAGAAVVVPDGELDGPRLAREVARLLGSKQRLGEMASAARRVALPDAAALIAEETLGLVRGG